MVEARFSTGPLNDIVFVGLRFAIGAIFIAHGLSKFNEGFVGFLTGPVGLPAAMQIPLALAEVIPGILVIFGILSRMSSSLMAIVSLGAIFHIKHASNITGQGGFEIDLILLAANLVIITMGPGRASVSHMVKKLPRFLH